MVFFAKTDKGRKRRMNQDYVFATDQAIGSLPNLFLLADGMGGHKAGDYASRFAVEELKSYIGYGILYELYAGALIGAFGDVAL